MTSLISILISAALAVTAFHPSDDISVKNGRIQGIGFEFPVNGEVVTSLDPVWKLSGTESSTPANGSDMVTYHFSGKGRYRGLEVFIDRQYFPGEDFIRERMRLQSKTKDAFRFTDVDGANYFVFPSYKIPVTEGGCEVKEIKIGNFVTKPARGNHTYFPTETGYSLSLGESVEVKGPIVRIIAGDKEIITSYEHASQDVELKYKRTEEKAQAGVDASQGVRGNMDVITVDDLWFIATEVSVDEDEMHIRNRIRHGAYVNNEPVPSDGFYETVWSTISTVPGDKTWRDVVNDYLYSKISGNPASRKPDFYYNTWAMQREMPPEQLRSVLTEEKVLKEIELASELGVDIFVIDDGWQSGVGIWKVNKEKFPGGFAPVVESMKSKGITPGIWLSLLGIQGNSDRIKEHPDWIIRDKSGEPLQGQYNHPVFDLGTGVYDLILDDLKCLVDEGFRFFKWDAINTFSSSLPGAGHGDETSDIKERMNRYNYMLPFYVSRLMRELREYNPEVVVEIDVTENRRALMGLMMLQEGKFFFVNNGASQYKDYTIGNAKSKRRATTEMASLFPPELLTFAVYPHNQGGTLKYNVHSILASGHGFWGRLDAATPEERAWVKYMTSQAKRVLEHTKGHPLQIDGGLNDSPQTFVQSDKESGYALVTAFTHDPAKFDVKVNLAKPLGVTCSPFKTIGDSVEISFDLSGEGDSGAAFVIGHDEPCRSILSSTGALKDIVLRNGYLHIVADTDTDIMIEGETEPRHIDAGREVIVPAEVGSPDFAGILSHPRLLFKAGVEDTIREAMKKSGNGYLVSAHGSAMAIADDALTREPLDRPDSGHILSVSRTVMERVVNLAYAYRMTGEAKYSDRALKEMLNVCTFRDWDPGHFLDTAEMIFALSIGYDWLYDRISPENRATIETAIIEKGLKQAQAHPGFYKHANNWNSVCNACLVAGSLAIYDKYPQYAKDFVSKALETNPMVLREYAPDGAYAEGYTYWGYGTGFQVMLFQELIDNLGSEAGLSGSPGFMNTGKFISFMETPTGHTFSFSDTTDQTRYLPFLFWFARTLDDPSLVFIEKKKLEARKIKYGIDSSRFIPFILIFSAGQDLSSAGSPKEHFWFSRGLTPMFIYRSGWESGDDTYLAVKGGAPVNAHGHMDNGEFYFEKGGVIWAKDLGSQSYGMFYNHNVNCWDFTQDGDRWGIWRYCTLMHNTLTVNGGRHLAKGDAQITEVWKNHDRKGCCVDMSETLSLQLAGASREVYLTSDDTLMVVDHLKTRENEPATVYWNMTTMADAEVTGPSEITMTRDGKTLKLEVLSPEDVTMSVQGTDSPVSWDVSNPGSSRAGFTVLCPAGRSVDLVVRMSYSDEGKRVSILPLGDSITQGGGSHVSYTYPLWKKLTDAGYGFSFVGPRQTTYDVGVINHCGFGGKTIEYLDSKIDSLYRIYPADVVLLHAGHNHFADKNPVPGMIESFKSVIGKILAINPNAVIYVAQVIESGKLPKYSYIPDFNERIKELVRSYNSSQIILVDAGRDFDWETCTVDDKVHPNAKGAEKIADAWFDALAEHTFQ